MLVIPSGSVIWFVSKFSGIATGRRLSLAFSRTPYLRNDTLSLQWCGNCIRVPSMARAVLILLKHPCNNLGAVIVRISSAMFLPSDWHASFEFKQRVRNTVSLFSRDFLKFCLIHSYFEFIQKALQKTKT